MGGGGVDEPDAAKDNLPAGGEVVGDLVEDLGGVGLEEFGVDGDEVAVGVGGFGVGVGCWVESLGHELGAPTVEGVGAEIGQGVLDVGGGLLGWGEGGIPEAVVGSVGGFEDDAAGCGEPVGFVACVVDPDALAYGVDGEVDECDPGAWGVGGGVEVLVGCVDVPAGGWACPAGGCGV